ncbi:MAG: cupredoxin domain-containing protein [Mycobacterium sp.]
MKKMCMFWAAMGLVAAIVAACGDSTSTDEAATTETTATTTTAATGPPAAPEPTAPAAAGATITIENMAFGEPLTVAPGAEITVANNDSAEHSVTSQTAGAFDLHVDGQQKATLIAPTQPGEYPFYCVYHPNMKGTLIVR